MPLKRRFSNPAQMAWAIWQDKPAVVSRCRARHASARCKRNALTQFSWLTAYQIAQPGCAEASAAANDPAGRERSCPYNGRRRWLPGIRPRAWRSRQQCRGVFSRRCRWCGTGSPGAGNAADPRRDRLSCRDSRPRAEQEVTVQSDIGR